MSGWLHVRRVLAPSKWVLLCHLDEDRLSCMWICSIAVSSRLEIALLS